MSKAGLEAGRKITDEVEGPPKGAVGAQSVDLDHVIHRLAEGDHAADPPGAAWTVREVDDEVEGIVYGALGQLVAVAAVAEARRLHHIAGGPVDGQKGIVGMDRDHRPVVAGAHRGADVRHLGATRLAEEDAFRAEAKRRADELSHGESRVL